MSEPAKNPFDALLDAFRQVVREEISKAATANSSKGTGFWTRRGGQAFVRL
jgi:hypothetical protein